MTSHRNQNVWPLTKVLLSHACGGGLGDGPGDGTGVCSTLGDGSGCCRDELAGGAGDCRVEYAGGSGCRAM